MQLVFQALQAPGGLQEVLSKDLLLLSGVGGYSDGVPDLNQNGLMEEEQLSSGTAWSSTRLCTGIATVSPSISVCLLSNKHILDQRISAPNSFPLFHRFYKQTG